MYLSREYMISNEKPFHTFEKATLCNKQEVQNIIYSQIINEINSLELSFNSLFLNTKYN